MFKTGRLLYQPIRRGRNLVTRSFSANPYAQGKNEFLPFPQRQIRQPVSFGETISFNLKDLWDKLPDVTVNKHTTLGEVFDGYYTNYKFRKIYGVAAFVGVVFWLFHVRELNPDERVMEKLKKTRLEKLEKGEQEQL